MSEKVRFSTRVKKPLYRVVFLVYYEQRRTIWQLRGLRAWWGRTIRRTMWRLRVWDVCNILDRRL